MTATELTPLLRPEEEAAVRRVGFHPLVGGRRVVEGQARTGAWWPRALAPAAYLWQVAHPTPTLAALYERVPEWGHVTLDFAPRFRELLNASATGLASAERVAEQP